MDQEGEAERPVSAVDAARTAALSRSTGSGSASSNKDDKAEKDLRLKLLKIIDDEMMGNYKRPQALAALELLQLILANALEDQNKRSVRLSNPAFLKRVGNRALLDGPFTLYLHESGFRHQVVNFEARRVFPADPRPEQLRKCQLAEEVARTRREVIVRSHEADVKAREADKVAEEARTAIAKRHMEDDRVSVQARVAREQAARAAASEEKPGEAGPPPYS